MNTNAQQELERLLSALPLLARRGWCQVKAGAFLFRSPTGRVHDLSAADLTQLDRIEQEHLFVVA